MTMPEYPQQQQPLQYLPSPRYTVMRRGPLDYSGVQAAAWVILIIACAPALLPFLGFLAWILAVPLLITAMWLSRRFAAYVAVGFCGEAEVRMGKKDPGEVILDELGDPKASSGRMR